MEIIPYFLDAFGSYERIDYGTGHEMNFFVFLYCLFRIGLYSEEHFAGAVNKVFERYLTLMRRLQTIYLLEPAGSHGVWGLDDYQHLAFILGAGQFLGTFELSPDCIHNEDLLEKERDNYMYLGCIHFIKSVKKGVPFGESSPTLNDISGVPNWNKVAQGMVKMYCGEVLNKLPVVHHLRFGSILAFDPAA